MRTRVSAAVVVEAAQPVVFAAITDWAAQSLWMLGTRVEPVPGASQLGGELVATTGSGPLRIVDPMTITRWEPPHRVDVRHTGRVVRGTGVFRVLALPGGRSRFIWAEELDLPLGLAGRGGFEVVRPVFLAGVRNSLARFARLVEAGTLPGGSM